MEREWEHHEHRDPDRVEDLLETLVAQGAAMATDIETIEAHLADETDVVASAVLLLNTLADDLRAGVNDPAAVAAVIANIDANKQRMADAIATDTPAAPVVDPPVDTPPADVPPADVPPADTATL